MSAIRHSASLRRSLVRPFLHQARITPFSTRTQHLSSSDYGSGEGDPKGERPKEQGPNPSEGLEHPGPPPPDVGQSKGGVRNDGSKASGGSSSSPSSHSDSSNGGKNKTRSSGNGGKGAQPKILNEGPPGEPTEDVRSHNREVKQRAERAHEKVEEESSEKKDDQKVPKSFWAGKKSESSW